MNTNLSNIPADNVAFESAQIAAETRARNERLQADHLVSRALAHFLATHADAVAYFNALTPEPLQVADRSALVSVARRVLATLPPSERF